MSGLCFPDCTSLPAQRFWAYLPIHVFTDTLKYIHVTALRHYIEMRDILKDTNILKYYNNCDIYVLILAYLSRENIHLGTWFLVNNSG